MTATAEQSSKVEEIGRSTDLSIVYLTTFMLSTDPDINLINKVTYWFAGKQRFLTNIKAVQYGFSDEHRSKLPILVPAYLKHNKPNFLIVDDFEGYESHLVNAGTHTDLLIILAQKADFDARYASFVNQLPKNQRRKIFNIPREDLHLQSNNPLRVALTYGFAHRGETIISRLINGLKRL